MRVTPYPRANVAAFPLSNAIANRGPPPHLPAPPPRSKYKIRFAAGYLYLTQKRKSDKSMQAAGEIHRKYLESTAPFFAFIRLSLETENSANRLLLQQEETKRKPKTNKTKRAKA